MKIMQLLVIWYNAKYFAPEPQKPTSPHNVQQYNAPGVLVAPSLSPLAKIITFMSM